MSLYARQISSKSVKIWLCNNPLLKNAPSWDFNFCKFLSPKGHIWMGYYVFPSIIFFTLLTSEAHCAYEISFAELNAGHNSVKNARLTSKTPTTKILSITTSFTLTVLSNVQSANYVWENSWKQFLNVTTIVKMEYYHVLTNAIEEKKYACYVLINVVSINKKIL